MSAEQRNGNSGSGDNAAPDERTVEASVTTEPQRTTGAAASRPNGALVVGFYTIIGVICYFSIDSFESWVNTNYVPIGTVALLVLAMWLVPNVRRSLQSIAPSAQAGLLALVGLPFVAGIFVWISTLQDAQQIIAYRWFFIVIASLLPPALFYLFLVGRKRSLLQEHLTNLNRLGVLAAQEGESALALKYRLYAYVQKFEVVYGSLPNRADIVLKLLAESTGGADGAAGQASGERDAGDLGSEDLGAIFTKDTAVPVVVATALILLGWLVTLPPWEHEQHFTSPGIVAQNPAAPIPGTPAAEQDTDAGAAADEQRDPDAGAEGSTASAPPARAATPQGTKWEAMFQPHQLATNYAFLGAYFFILQTLVRRYVRKDLRPNAYVSASARIILSFIGIWVVASAWQTAFGSDSQELLYVMGFVIGAFPPVAWQVARVAIQKVTFSSVFLPSLETSLPLNRLDGLTVWHQARLEEEDVENVPNMATANLPELMLNTKFPPDRIIDWVDQAILFTHLGARPPTNGDDTAASSAATNESLTNNPAHGHLSAYGVRSASALLGWLANAEAEQTIPGLERPQIDALRASVETNVNLPLIVRWKAMKPVLLED